MYKLLFQYKITIVHILRVAKDYNYIYFKHDVFDIGLHVHDYNNIRCSFIPGFLFDIISKMSMKCQSIILEKSSESCHFISI